MSQKRLMYQIWYKKIMHSSIKKKKKLSIISYVRLYRVKEHISVPWLNEHLHTHTHTHTCTHTCTHTHAHTRTHTCTHTHAHTHTHTRAHTHAHTHTHTHTLKLCSHLILSPALHSSWNTFRHTRCHPLLFFQKHMLFLSLTKPNLHWTCSVYLIHFWAKIEPFGLRSPMQQQN